MKEPPPDAAQIHEMIWGLSQKHILSNSPQAYVDDFVVAALEVYDPATLQKTLQHKFFIPDESNYKEDTYYQSASELAVSHYIKQKEKQKLVTNFECDKRLNLPTLKDVDNYFQVRWTKVSLEVKCPLEDKQAPFPGNITLKTVGRAPDLTGIEQMKAIFESRTSGTNFPMGKNPDLRMKDCLESANQKFNSKSGVDDLNLLFLSCGQFHNMSEWYICLYGPGGLFTSQSFAPEARCPNVDLVILSNLKYRHEQARAHSAWTPDDVLLLPIVNPHGRSNRTSDAIEEGLSVFHHYQKEFALFHGRELVWDKQSESLVSFEKQIKVSCFVMEHLTPEEFARFFPTIDRSMFEKSPTLMPKS